MALGCNYLKQMSLKVVSLMKLAKAIICFTVNNATCYFPADWRRAILGSDAYFCALLKLDLVESWPADDRAGECHSVVEYGCLLLCCGRCFVDVRRRRPRD
jgi:hypothetical protein